MSDLEECIGACGAAECAREDCRTCEGCGAYFDRDTEGFTCDTYGDQCGECRDRGAAYYCHSECCYSGPDTQSEWRGER